MCRALIFTDLSEYDTARSVTAAAAAAAAAAAGKAAASEKSI